MFGFGYRKRAIAAEALVDKLRADVAYEREKAARYERLWLQSVKPGPVQRVPAGVYVPPKPSERTRTKDRYEPATAMSISSMSANTGGGFDMTSALLGGIAGYAIGSHDTPTATAPAPSFSSGGGGDYGGGGASSSWGDSSSSCSSSSSDSSSYSSSDSSSSSCSSSD